jgi:antitoxin component YwqK of YwqJK toxin-antitoxin module
LVACGGEEGSGVGLAKLPEGVRSEAVEHEACSESGHRVEILDANGDGKADIKRVYDKGTGKEICRIADLNHDGKPDLYEYYGADGTIRRREADYDDNGIVDSIDYYENGKMVRREYDTTGQHRIDTWDYFDKDSGKRLRRERDTNNDGKVDQWWVWDGDKVTISTDKNGDGKPDPETVIVLGGTDGGLGPAPPSSSTPPVQPDQADHSLLDAGAVASDAGTAAKRKGP